MTAKIPIGIERKVPESGTDFKWPFPTYKALSWNGFNVCGDDKSIAEVTRLMHYAPQWKNELDQLRADAQRFSKAEKENDL